MLLSELELKRATRDPAVAERPDPYNTRSLFFADAGYRIERDGSVVLLSHSGRTVMVPVDDVLHALVAPTSHVSAEPDPQPQPVSTAKKAKGKP